MGHIQIGWSIRDISTNKPVCIPGQFHQRVSQGIADPLFATALVITDSNDSAIFLSIDAIAIRCGLLDEIKHKVSTTNKEIPVTKILVNATHTHESPCHYHDTYPEDKACGASDAPLDFPHPGIDIASCDEYRDFLSTQAAEAVCEAWDVKEAGGIGYGYGYAVVAHSRRVVYFDDVSKRAGAINNATHGVNGHSVMYGITNNKNFSHYEAGADHFLNLMFTFDENEQLTGAIVNIPCPAQNSELTESISADYWSDIRRALSERYGNIFILPQCAAAGDLAPRILHYRQAQTRRFRLKYGCTEPIVDNGSTIDQIGTWGIEQELCARKDIAERVATAFGEVLSWARNEIFTNLPIVHDVRTIKLSKRLINENEFLEDSRQFDAHKGTPFLTEGTPSDLLFQNSCLTAERSRHKAIMDRYTTQNESQTIPMELHTIRIGDIAFASNRFELYMDYQHRIQARSPFLQTFIVQLAGVPGEQGGTYLSTERGAAGRGYSASHYCNIVSPKGGQELVEQTLDALNDVANTKGD